MSCVLALGAVVPACAEVAGAEDKIDMPCQLADRASCPRHLKCEPTLEDETAGHCVELECYYGPSDCPTPGQCVDGTCMSPGEMAGEGRVCQKRADCPAHLVCVPGLYASHCDRPPCYVDTDCAPDLVCHNLKCVVPSC